MTSLNPFTGDFYRQALQISRYTREMFCLMEGRHVHPSTLYAGGTGTVATQQLFTDYYSRLMRYIEYMKVCVPLHDDLFDFWYDALPGYEHNGERRILLGCWGAFQDPDHCDFTYKNMTNWGRKMFVTPGVVVDGKLVTNDLVQINLGIRILLGPLVLRRLGERRDVRAAGSARQSGRPPPSLEHAHAADAEEARLREPVQLGDVAALVRRQGSPRARHRRRRDRAHVVDGALGPGRHRLRQGDRQQRADQPAQERAQRPGLVRVEGSQVVEHARTQPRADVLPSLLRGRALHFLDKAFEELNAGRTRSWEPFTVPEEAHRLRLHRGRARRALAPHGDPRRQDRELPSVAADAVERQSARHLRHAGSVRRRRAEHADLRRERAGQRSRASTSCVRCAASIRACRAACTCISATARRSRRCIRRSRRSGKPPWSLPDGASRRRGTPASGGRRWPTGRGLLAGFDAVSNAAPSARAGEELVRTIVTLYGAGSSACSRSFTSSGERSDEVFDRSARTSSSRACSVCTACIRSRSKSASQRALESVRPYLKSHEGEHRDRRASRTAS
jgi:hypothetical protein